MNYDISPASLRLIALVTLAAAQAACTSPRSDSALDNKAATGVEALCSASSDPRIQEMTDQGIGLTSALGLASGRYALPVDPAPTQMVVMFHGNHNDSCSWRNHLRQAAERGAVAVAMDYTGQGTQDGIENWGWFVNEGAADSIAAAKLLLAKYPSITRVIAFGVSMGGNASGMAVASADAVRADGSPLFDYWVDVEGVNNLIEEYGIVRAIAPGVGAAAVALAEIEEEAGGAIEDVPDAYTHLTNLYRAGNGEIKVKGAIIVNGVDDGLVPTVQSPELASALNASGIPAHLFTVLLKGDGESGTTATGSFVLGPDAAGGPVYTAATGQPYESPLAGHGWEGSDTQLVIKTGLDQLWSLLAGGDVSPCESVVHGTGTETDLCF